MKQIGLALHGYHDVHGTLPPGRMMTYDPRFSGPRPPCTSSIVDKSILVMVLPYLEQGVLYNAINQSVTILGFENRTIHTASVGSYFCPSDPESGRPRELDMTQMLASGLANSSERLTMVFTSYAGCYGAYFVDALQRPTLGCQITGSLVAQADGMFNDLSPLGFASVGDGLSNTIFIVEKATTHLHGIDPENLTPFRRHGWYVTGNWGDTLATAFYPPNAYRKVSPVAEEGRAFSASSMHAGGLNVLMGDGSVRFINDSVQSWPFQSLSGEPVGAIRTPGGWWVGLPARGVWQALATRSGSENISTDAY